MRENITILLIFGIGYVCHLIYKSNLKKRAQTAFQKFLKYLDDYELELLKDFDAYTKDLKFVDFEDGKKSISESPYFKDSDIRGAYLLIIEPIVKKTSEKLYFYGKEVNVLHFKTLRTLFENSNNKEKLDFINKKIEVHAIDIAVENSYSVDIKKNKIGAAAEFIALRAFNLETLLDYQYPEYNYKLLYKLLKQRKKNAELTSEEFWSLVN